MKGQGKRGGAGKAGKPPSPPPPQEEISPEVMEFIQAIESHKKRHQKPFPTWSEVFQVLLSLGYRRPGGPEPGAGPGAGEP